MTSPPAISLLGAAGLLALAVVLTLSACRDSGDKSNPSSAAVLDLISNGSTLPLAESRWVSTECRLEVELTRDHGFWSIVDDSGKRSSIRGRWTEGKDPHSVTIAPGPDVGGFWVSAISKIDGSISARTFTAQIAIKTRSTTKDLGSCTFALMQHGLAPAVGQVKQNAAPLPGD